VRVVSLVPSVTESLATWGVDPVAVTRFCERLDLRTVGGTKDPDVAAIVALAPDLVVMNDEENRAEDAAALVAAGLRVHVTRVRAVEDVGPELERLAAAVGDSFFERHSVVVHESRSKNERRAFVPIWRRPWMTLNGDTYGSSLLERLGIGNVYADAPERYPTVTLDDARSRSPDVVLAPSEPYPFSARHAGELAQVAPVELVDGRDLFWWGTRTPQAAARLGSRLRALTS
jgi:ABC-type Fe3+-hydroxamate transport system substrate-binding protein